MSLIDRRRKSDQELARFGFTMAALLGIFGGVAFVLHKPFGPFLVSIALLFSSFGLAAPRALAPIERYWLAFGNLLSAIMSRVVLFLMFFLVFTPLGLLQRIVGRDELQLRHKNEAETYWIPVEKDGPGSRFFKPY